MGIDDGVDEIEPCAERPRRGLKRGERRRQPRSLPRTELFFLRDGARGLNALGFDLSERREETAVLVERAPPAHSLLEDRVDLAFLCERETLPPPRIGEECPVERKGELRDEVPSADELLG